MEFLLLGPLAVRDDAGAELRPRGTKQRALLSLLILNRGHVVTTDRLLDVLWPSGPPTTATTALQGHVSQLRKLLGHERLETHTQGYRLAAADAEVDLDRFETLVAEARRLPDPVDRAARLTSALALWRGPPADEIAGHASVHAELERLAELRLVAQETLIDAELDCGRGGDLVPQLEALVSEHPYRERLHALLMQALYRGGRQADALAAYRTVRTLLVDELGIEPGDELQRLEKQILNQDPALHAGAPLPTGTVTFVFTDVEGSTALLRELGAERYAATLADHRRTVRDAFSARSGVEVDSQGDSFFYAFARAADAAAAAEVVQDAHAHAPLRVRIGIHTGEPIIRDGGYVGLEVHHAARIAAAAHGGQIVLSGTTRALIPDLSAHALGEHRLKDFPQRISLWQLGEGEFPPLRTLGRTELPVAAPVLYGRETDLARIGALVRSGEKLLTLVGPGGAGKTQLALHAARALVDDFDDGVFFVDLAPLRDAGLVRSAIASALALRDAELYEAFVRRRQLVVLDNAEHLPQLAAVIAPCVGGASVLLVTSRAPLKLRFEQQIAVEPLDADAAVELFLARAAAAGRVLHRDDTVRAICERLDNLPLAVELAAARAKHVAPVDLLSRLGVGLDVLATGPHDAPDRQHTLRNTMDWAYQLLDRDEQAAFAALSVFAGGWTLDAAEAVCGVSLDPMAALVEQSLIRQADMSSARFSMLETMRSYAHDVLVASSRFEDIACRHAHWFADFAESAAAEIASANPRAALRALELDIDNLRAALAWSREHEPETMARLTVALARFWSSRGLFDEGRDWLAAVLAGIDLDSERGVELLMQAGAFARHAGDLDGAVEFFERGLETAEEIDSPRRARFLMLLGQAELLAGRLDSAEERLARASTIQHAADDVVGSALTAVSMGVIHLERGKPESAADAFATGVTGLRAGGDEISLAVVLALAAYAQALSEHHEQARVLWREGLELATTLRLWPTAAWALLVASFVEAADAPAAAARWAAAGEGAYADQHWAWEPTEIRVRDDAVAAIRSHLSESDWQDEYGAGRASGLDAAIRDALTFVPGSLVMG